jgi:pimeloyl-ACP methyl ester carboxylesterase
MHATQALPGFVRNVFRSSLSGDLLQSMLESEMGEYAIRRCWGKPDTISPEVYQGHRLALRVSGWEAELRAWVDSHEESSDAAVKILVGARRGAETGGAEINVISGELDQVSTVDDSAKPLSSLSSANHVIIPDCGHLPAEEQPQLFVEALRQLSHIND